MPDVIVDLETADGMFATPPDDPAAPGFALSTGMERAVAGASALGVAARGRARLVVRMPSPGPDDARRIAASVATYVTARRADAGLRMVALRREGVRTLGVAAVFIAACLLAWLTVEIYPHEGLLKDLARDGVVIAGWVALWRPLDLLLFDTWLLRRDRRILEAVAAMPVVVEATGRA